MLIENFNVDEWLVEGEEVLFELVEERLDEDEDVECILDNLRIIEKRSGLSNVPLRCKLRQRGFY